MEEEADYEEWMEKLLAEEKFCAETGKLAMNIEDRPFFSSAKIVS